MPDIGLRGTDSSQDSRFKDKEAAAIKAISKFPKNFSEKVDLRKVNISVLRGWIAQKVTELIRIEDDVVVEYVYGLLEDKDNPIPDPRKMQVTLVGFMDKHGAAAFMSELWTLLLSAQATVGGVPAEFIAAKKAELEAQQRNDRHTGFASRTQASNSFEGDRRQDRGGRFDLPNRPGGTNRPARRPSPPAHDYRRGPPPSRDPVDRKRDRTYRGDRGDRNEKPRDSGWGSRGNETRPRSRSTSPRRDDFRQRLPSSPPRRRISSPRRRSPPPPRYRSPSPRQREHSITPPLRVRSGRERQRSATPPVRERSRSRTPTNSHSRSLSMSRSRSRSPTLTPPRRRRQSSTPQSNLRARAEDSTPPLKDIPRSPSSKRRSSFESAQRKIEEVDVPQKGRGKFTVEKQGKEKKDVKRPQRLEGPLSKSKWAD